MILRICVSLECAIKAAFEEGTLSRDRYELYKGLHAESQHSAKMKAIAKERKIWNKNKR